MRFIMEDEGGKTFVVPSEVTEVVMIAAEAFVATAATVAEIHVIRRKLPPPDTNCAVFTIITSSEVRHHGGEFGPEPGQC